jgi:penicillin-binding protein 2
MGERMKVDTIRAYAEKLGLVGPTGIDLPNELDSRVPSEAWAREVRNDRWYPSETISVAIGQGPVDVTPLALATMMATVANGGRLVTPHLVRGVNDGSGWQPVEPPAARSQVTIPPEVLSAVRDGLWMTVNQDGGTGWRARLPGRDVSGKTGTAQVISNMNRAAAEATGRDFRDNGWFVFLAPRDNPQIAGVVFVEHAGGAAPAMPIVRHVLETFFAKRDGLPLPPLNLDSIQRNIRASAATGAPGPAAQASAPAPRPAGGNPTGGGGR